MNSKIEQLLDDAENRYLKTNELAVLGQYVTTLNDRLTAYRTLRDQELEIMQPVADALQAACAQESTDTLERCLKNALLVLRYCAMAMLLDDELFVRDRLSGWLEQVTKVYNTEKVDQQLYRLLTQQISQTLPSQHFSLIQPHLQVAQTLLTSSASQPLNVG
jgi:uncharacterized protein (UPF0332 family)